MSSTLNSLYGLGSVTAMSQQPNALLAPVQSVSASPAPAPLAPIAPSFAPPASMGADPSTTGGSPSDQQRSAAWLAAGGNPKVLAAWTAAGGQGSPPDGYIPGTAGYVIDMPNGQSPEQQDRGLRIAHQVWVQNPPQLMNIPYASDASDAAGTSGRMSPAGGQAQANYDQNLWNSGAIRPWKTGQPYPELLSPGDMGYRGG